MHKRSVFVVTAMLSIAAMAKPAAPTNAPAKTNTPAPPKGLMSTNAPAKPHTISVQEMLVSGPTQLKLYSLAMITQGKIKGTVDDSYLPGLKVCAEDPALPLRSVTAQILGQYFIQGKEKPNPEALALLIKLARDKSSYVRYNAVYYGLSQIKNKSDDIINLLIDIASKDRQENLIDRIAESLKPDHDQVVKILNQKLAKGNNIAIFEIYKTLTGEEPTNVDKYLKMPSSLPYLFVFKGEGTDSDAGKADLEKALKDAGIENPDVQISGQGQNYVLLVKTYITKDRLTINKAFANNPAFKITQSMWLTPEMEAQINAMKKKK